MIEDELNTGDVPDVQCDETLRDVIASLGSLPAVDESDVQRIVARASAEAAESGRRREHRWTATRPSRETRDAVVSLRSAKLNRFSAMPFAAAAALVLAAGIGGFVLRGALTGETTSPSRAASSEARGARPGDMIPVSAVSADVRAEAAIETQFVLDAPDAAQVALVGAFNSWDAEATPLVRDRLSGLWSVTVPLAPGRHVYAFMVDDSALTLDPRAPSARDPELGTSGSVILVGTP